MSVLKSKRRESRFEVFHSFYKMRKELTNLAYRKFGYKGNPESQDYEFCTYIVTVEAKAIVSMMQECQKYITMANSIFPTSIMECDERRKFQDWSIGLCFSIIQELQFVLESLPLDKDKFVRYADMINNQICLLKGWRQSDNAIRKRIEKGII